jgi:uncharacterized protein
MRFLSGIVILIVLFSGCRKSQETIELYFHNPAGTASPTILAEVARTPNKRSMGLMYRSDLSKRQGMIFIFPEEREQTFWMKNTYLELDIIFISRDLKVVSIVHRAVPLSTLARVSEVPAMYAVEIRGGLAEQWGIVPGSRLIAKKALPKADL